MESKMTPFTLMQIRLADFLGAEDRDAIITLLGWKKEQRERVKSTLHLLWEMQEIISKDNVVPLIKLLTKCGLYEAALLVENYQSSNTQAVKNAQGNQDNQPSSTGKRPLTEAVSPVSTKSLRSSEAAGVKKVFISFSLRSMDIVKDIKRKIEHRIGDKCWIYTEGILQGENIYESIAGAMSDAAVVLCMINQHYVDSEECEKEVLVARNLGKLTINVMLENMGRLLKKSDGKVSVMDMTYHGRPSCKFYIEDQREREEQFETLIAFIVECIVLGRDSEISVKDQSIKRVNTKRTTAKIKTENTRKKSKIQSTSTIQSNDRIGTGYQSRRVLRSHMLSTENIIFQPDRNKKMSRAHTKTSTPKCKTEPTKKKHRALSTLTVTNFSDEGTKVGSSRVLRSHVEPTKHSAEGESLNVLPFPNDNQTTESVPMESSTTTNNMEHAEEKLKDLPVPGVYTTGHRKMQMQSFPDNLFLKVKATVGKSGGTLEIPNTGVTLTIPPDALPDYMNERDINLKIIPHQLLKDETFSWNTSTVVELLPNNLKLKKHVTLTLPHCFVLKRPGSAAKVLVSHHEQEDKPCWDEEADSKCQVTHTSCIVQLKSFSWIRITVEEEEVVAKKIVLFTAGKKPLPNCNKCSVEIGYYPDLPGEDKFLQLNPSFIVTQRRPYHFRKDREHPLRLSVDAIIPRAWKLCAPREKVQEINYRTMSSSIGYSRPFTFQNKVKDPKLPIIHFKASQEGWLQPVVLEIQLEELHDQSRQHEKEPSDSMGPLFWRLSEKLTKDWKDVGRKLKIEDSILDQIGIDNKDNIREAIYAMFLRWFQEKGPKATCLILAAALKDAGRSDLASDVDIHTDGNRFNGRI